MSIFEGLMAMNALEGFTNQGGRPGGGIPGYGAGIMNGPQRPGMPDFPEQPYSGGYGDMSAFASSGMTPPAIPDAMSRIMGIMSMMGDPHKERKEDPIMQNQPGGLMAYLNALSEV